MPDYPSARDCEHGQLRRACPICEVEANLAELVEEVENLRDHNKYLDACLEDRNAEMMRHVRMYEALAEAVRWERECDSAWYSDNLPLKAPALYELFATYEAARAAVDALVGEG